MVARARHANRFKWLLEVGVVQRIIKRPIEKTVKGPSAAKRDTPTFVWGEVTNARGDKRTARIKTANGYSLTVTGALTMVEHLLACNVPGKLDSLDIQRLVAGKSAGQRSVLTFQRYVSRETCEAGWRAPLADVAIAFAQTGSSYATPSGRCAGACAEHHHRISPRALRVRLDDPSASTEERACAQS
jgi:hypothetical protein